MVFCSVSKCSNNSATCNYRNKGITFHRFPTDPDIKDKWIKICGKINWFPTIYSRICSVHFKEDDFNPTNLRRTLIHSAVPTINYWKLCTEDSIDTESPEDSAPTTSAQNSTSLRERASTSPDPSTSPARDPDKLRRVILARESVIAKQRLTIRNLQRRNKRYKKKILELEHILKNLQDDGSTSGD